MRAIALTALMVLSAGAAAGADGDDLYQGQTIVTGRGEASLARGLPACFEEVLVKVSGDPRLVGDPRAAGLVPQAVNFVREAHFRDRLAGMPTMDEQGTRDRPHDLTVRFHAPAIDAALRSLGREPWTAARPRVLAIVAVDNGTVRYALASDGDRGRDQRDALTAAATRFGLPVQLPSQAVLAAAGVDVRTLPAYPPSVVKATGGDVALVGSLVWRDDELGWAAEWRLAPAGKPHRWQIRGVSFDVAFRNGMAGAAQVLSGHGHPAPGLGSGRP